MDLSEELDRAIGDGPPLPPPESLLPHGRRALARRRAAVTAGALAVVAVVAAGAAGATALREDPAAGPAPAARPTVAGDGPTTPSAPTADPPSRAEIRRVLSSDPVAFTDGHLAVRPGATVVERLDNPYHLAAPRTSVAVAVEVDGATYWFVLVVEGDGSSNGASAYSGDLRKDFQRWVADHAGLADSTDPESDRWAGIPGLELVRFAGPGGDRLEPVGGVRLVRQVARPDLGPAWAGPEARSAAAEVVKDGERYYVLARAMDGKPQYIAVTEADGGPTLEAFLDLARDRYAEGGGGLL